MGIGLFLLFDAGVYAGALFVSKSIYNSRLRILEGGILNEQVEMIRNLAYADVGIAGGSPSGVLLRTVTTTRNGIDFIITRTIRSIDDPYDGMIGGSPNDIAPADYKLVHLEIVCDGCVQQNPLSFFTHAGPRTLEGDPTHGALFIQVFDAVGAPVSNASVHVIATSTQPAIDLTDTTDQSGMLKLVDLPSGINAYEIVITKAGYTSEQTIESSPSIPNPVHPLASVVAQDVTEVSFAIDRVSSLIFTALDGTCTVIPDISFTLRGTKLIGVSPDVPKIDELITVDGGGGFTRGEIDWDNYSILPSGYDLIGVIPQLPLPLSPGVNQPSQIILGSNTPRSLLVNVRDGVTLQSVNSATVMVIDSEDTLMKITDTPPNQCTPPGQAYFGNLGGGTYTVDVGKAGYQTSPLNVSVTGDVAIAVDLAAE